MTDPTTPATPEATEREARDVVTMCYHPSDFSEAEFLSRLDAYRAAVAAVEYERGRRAERERLVQIVEGMRLTGRKHVGRCTSKCGDGPCSHTAADFHNAALDALLAKLREAK